MIPKRMQAAYNQIAPQYATINAAMPQALIEHAARFLRLTGPTAGILDAGGGAGRDMAWFEHQGVQVTGLDLSGGMLRHARRQVQGHVLHMDMRHLALRTGSYDGMGCTASLLQLPKHMVPSALLEFHRVLRPGGVLFLAVQEGTGEHWERTPDGTVERLFVRYTAQEMVHVLTKYGFTMHEQVTDQAGARHWLQCLATA